MFTSISFQFKIRFNLYKFLLFFTISFNPHFAIGQSCLPEGLNIEEQQEIDDFVSNYPGCTEIMGDLTIGILNPTNITNLLGLSQVSSIGGNLKLFHNPNLVNLDGLENISSIGGALIIDQNKPSLSSLEGLNNLISVGNYLSISNNDGLNSLSGLASLISVNGYVYIAANANLVDLIGLNNLTSINGLLRVSGNDKLASLSGIDSLDHTSIADLRILANPMLSICDVKSVCDYLSLPSNTSTISLNATGCNTRDEIETVCAGALPINLIYFKIKEVNHSSIIITWLSDSELNFDGYEIQRSKDLHVWTIIGFLKKQKTSGIVSKYEFNDISSLRGINYYRLKIYDLDGTYEYSKVIEATYIKNNKVKFYPNPTSGHINILGLNSFDYRIQVFDLYGKKLEINRFENNLDFSHLPNGIYTVYILQGPKISDFRIAKL